MSDKRDVVIFEIETKKIDAIAGRDLPWRSVERRLATVLPRLNDRYDACTVPPGKYNVGDVLAEADQCEDWSESRRALSESDS